jgi:hypothetical protein
LVNPVEKVVQGVPLLLETQMHVWHFTASKDLNSLLADQE